MGLLDLFRSSDKIVEKTADGIYNGLDKLVFTDEEKADAKQRAFQADLDFKKLMMQEGSPSAISRRILAWAISGVYMSLVVVSCIIWRFNQEWAKFIIENGVARIEFAFGAVISTYFIYHGLKQVFKK